NLGSEAFEIRVPIGITDFNAVQGQLELVRLAFNRLRHAQQHRPRQVLIEETARGTQHTVIVAFRKNHPQPAPPNRGLALGNDVHVGPLESSLAGSWQPPASSLASQFRKGGSSL